MTEITDHVHLKAQQELNRLDEKLRPVIQGESVASLIGISVYCLGLAHEYTPVRMRQVVHDVFDAAKQIWHATLLAPEVEDEWSGDEQTEVRGGTRDPGSPPPRAER